MSSKINQNPGLTTQEILSTLRHSCITNVLVEGVDDLQWYGLMLQKAKICAEPIQAGGRENLLSVFEQLTPSERVTNICVADQDIWYFIGIPKQYSDVVFTTGYSIENDVLHNSAAINLISEDELQLIEKYRSILSEWFAFCIDEKKQGRTPVLDVHPEHIVKKEGEAVSWRPNYQSQIGFVRPKELDVKKVYDEFYLGFRGKSLVKLYALILSSRKGKNPKYSDSQLMDIAVQARDLDGLRLDLMSRIRSKITCAAVSH